MNEQAEQDWWETDMDATQQAEVKARVMALVDLDATAIPMDLRARLERASAVHYPR